MIRTISFRASKKVKDGDFFLNGFIIGIPPCQSNPNLCWKNYFSDRCLEFHANFGHNAPYGLYSEHQKITAVFRCRRKSGRYHDPIPATKK